MPSQHNSSLTVEDPMEELNAESDWYLGTSPQWTEILSPYPDFGSFVDQFIDPDMGTCDLDDSSFSSQQSGTTSASPSFASVQTSPESQTCGCSTHESDHPRGLFQDPLDADMPAGRHAGIPPPISRSSAKRHEAAAKHSLVDGKVPIPPADRPPERPKRKINTPQTCLLEDCGKVFACQYDLNRHLRDMHTLGYWIYKCSGPGCGYVRPRKDKVKEHCTKRKHPGYVAIYIGDGQNAGELASMIEQRRKKGKHKSACRECGEQQHTRGR